MREHPGPEYTRNQPLSCRVPAHGRTGSRETPWAPAENTATDRMSPRYGTSGSAGVIRKLRDKPGPVTLHCGPQDARGPQCTAGLRDCDKRGACHPGPRGWDNSSPRPVYGRLPFCRGATEAFGRRHGLPTHWSGGLCHPGPRRGQQPEAASGAPMCRPRPRTWVGAGPPRRGRARRT